MLVSWSLMKHQNPRLLSNSFQSLLALEAYRIVSDSIKMHLVYLCIGSSRPAALVHRDGGTSLRYLPQMAVGNSCLLTWKQVATCCNIARTAGCLCEGKCQPPQSSTPANAAGRILFFTKTNILTMLYICVHFEEHKALFCEPLSARCVQNGVNFGVALLKMGSRGFAQSGYEKGWACKNLPLAQLKHPMPGKGEPRTALTEMIWLGWSNLPIFRDISSNDSTNLDVLTTPLNYASSADTDIPFLKPQDPNLFCLRCIRGWGQKKCNNDHHLCRYDGISYNLSTHHTWYWQVSQRPQHDVKQTCLDVINYS